MSRPTKDELKATRSHRLERLAKRSAFLFLRVLRNIVGPLRAPEERVEDLHLNEPEECKAQSEVPERCIVFSDTDNDVDSVANTLFFAGITNEQGEFVEDLDGMTIFHTGDLVHKNKPDLSVLQYWLRLQQEALEKGCRVKLIAGNHEQKIWQRTRAGEKYGLEVGQARELSDFMEHLDLFHVAGHVLLIHGYPTLEFLQTLLHYQEVTGKDLNSFNQDHYRKSFISINAMRQYAYVKESRRKHHILYDLKDASRYYKTRGRLIAETLQKLKISVVVHGHKPQRSGEQVDYEFVEYMPKIRMINNDTNISRNGIGATVVRVTSHGVFNIDFINAETASDELRSKLKNNLLGPF
jgi:hypothetical protein